MYKSPIVVVDCDKEPNPYYKQFLHFLDILVSLFVIAPLVITYWRGTWNLLDIYLLPDSPLHSAIASVAIGLIGYMIFMLPQKYLSEQFDRDRHRVTFYVSSRLYTFVFGVISVLGCRGPWLLADLLTPLNLTAVNLLTLSAAFLLVITRSLANIIAPPFLIVADEREDYFYINTRFKTSVNHQPILYILDCIFSTLIVASLAAVVWRGVWAYFDIVLYPEDGVYSAWGSMIIGYTIAAVGFALQPLMRSLCNQIDGYWRLAVADAFLFFCFIGTMSIWRGIWLLLDIYFLPENQLLSNYLCFFVSFFILVLLNCSNSNLVRGVFVDCEEPAGRCVVFPIYYIRSVLQKQRSKAHRYLLDLLGSHNPNGNVLVVLEKGQHSTINVIKIDTSSTDCVLNEREKSESSVDSKDYTIVTCIGEDTSLLGKEIK